MDGAIQCHLAGREGSGHGMDGISWNVQGNLQWLKGYLVMIPRDHHHWLCPMTYISHDGVEHLHTDCTANVPKVAQENDAGIARLSLFMDTGKDLIMIGVKYIVEAYTYDIVEYVPILTWRQVDKVCMLQCRSLKTIQSLVAACMGYKASSKIKGIASAPTTALLEGNKEARFLLLSLLLLLLLSAELPLSMRVDEDASNASPSISSKDPVRTEITRSAPSSFKRHQPF